MAADKSAEHRADQQRPPSLPKGLRRWLIPPILLAGVAAVTLLSRLPPRGRVWVIYPPQELARIRNIHDYQGQPVCQACHVKGSAALLAEPMSLCSSECHNFNHKNHPVNVAAKDPSSTGLPLQDGRLLACHTCHDSHDLTRHPHGLRLPFTELCLRCHPRH